MKEPKKVQIHEFDPVIYPVKLWVTITENIDALSERFVKYPSKKNMSKSSLRGNAAITRLVSSRDTNDIGVLIVFTNRKHVTFKYAAHESSHATQLIWGHIGEYEYGDEANAYLIGWIADCCEKVKLNKE